MIIFNPVFVALLVLLLLVLASIKVLYEYERGVVFLLGRFQAVKGPGLILVIPVIQQMKRVDLRTVVMDVPSQEVISRDNVSVKVNAVIYWQGQRRDLLPGHRSPTGDYSGRGLLQRHQPAGTDYPTLRAGPARAG